MMEKYSKYFSSKLILLFVMLFILLIMLLFKPFGLNGLQGSELWINLIGMQVAMTFVCFLLLRLYDLFVPYDKVGVPYVILVMIVASSGVIYALGFLDVFVQVSFLRIVKELALICILPSFLFWLYFDRIFYSTYYDKATKVNKRLFRHRSSEKTEVSAQQSCVVINGKNQDNRLELPPCSLIYIMAQENYCQIYFHNNGQIEQRMFRTSLSNICDQLRAVDDFIIRCHRTYVVNLKHVEQMSGNSRGYFLKLKGCEKEIPVSRNFPDIYLLKQQFNF